MYDRTIIIRKNDISEGSPSFLSNSDSDVETFSNRLQFMILDYVWENNSVRIGGDQHPQKRTSSDIRHANPHA